MRTLFLTLVIVAMLTSKTESSTNETQKMVKADVCVSFLHAFVSSEKFIDARSFLCEELEGKIVHVQGFPGGGKLPTGKGRWTVKVWLPSSDEIITVIFETANKPTLKYCDWIKVNKCHHNDSGEIVVDEFEPATNPDPKKQPPPQDVGEKIKVGSGKVPGQITTKHKPCKCKSLDIQCDQPEIKVTLDENLQVGAKPPSKKELEEEAKKDRQDGKIPPQEIKKLPAILRGGAFVKITVHGTAIIECDGTPPLDCPAKISVTGASSDWPKQIVPDGTQVKEDAKLDFVVQYNTSKLAPNVGKFSGKCGEKKSVEFNLTYSAVLPTLNQNMIDGKVIIYIIPSPCGQTLTLTLTVVNGVIIKTEKS